MCGIAVAIDWENAEAVVAMMVSGLTHRGDVTDPVVSPVPNTAMVTRRLRIVDIERAQQPQLSYDGRILVAFNGEIYNHENLRRGFEAKGARFRTNSDTELLATALAIEGTSALEHFVGMYSFVAIDLRNRDFIAARDPLGIKPLYAIQSGRRFLFCSEIRPLLDASPTEQVMLIPPGYVVSKSALRHYRSFLSTRRVVGFQGSTADLDRRLAQAVHARLPAELPFAIMFSGGIDSTLVAHYARQVRPEAPAYFLGDSEAPDYPYAACYAEQNGLDLRLVPMIDAPSANLIGTIVGAIESFEPEVVRDSFCTYALSRQIHADGFRVVLCGEGADELFAGYDHLEVTFEASEEIGRSVRDQCLALMNRTNLQRLDRATMRFELEAREPFLDPSVVNYALDLDRSALLGWDGNSVRGKEPLRALYGLYPDQLPAVIRNRKKMPLSVGAGFDSANSETPWKVFVEDTVSDSEFAEGKRRFAEYGIHTKEEFYYLSKLSEAINISRVPHLKNRPRIAIPAFDGIERLRSYIL